MPYVCRAKSARGLVGVVEDEARRRIDRDGTGAGRRIRPTAGVHGTGPKSRQWVARAMSPFGRHGSATREAERAGAWTRSMKDGS